MEVWNIEMWKYCKMSRYVNDIRVLSMVVRLRTAPTQSGPTKLIKEKVGVY